MNSDSMTTAFLPFSLMLSELINRKVTTPKMKCYYVLLIRMKRRVIKHLQVFHKPFQNRSTYKFQNDNPFAVIAMDDMDDGQRDTPKDDEPSQPLNRKVVLPAYNTCPQISAFIPADIYERGVVFLDVKPWRLSLYPKSRCFCCIE